MDSISFVIKALREEAVRQAILSVTTPRDEDKSYAYGLSVGVERGLKLAISVAEKAVEESKRDPFPD